MTSFEITDMLPRCWLYFYSLSNVHKTVHKTLQKGAGGEGFDGAVSTGD